MPPAGGTPACERATHIANARMQITESDFIQGFVPEELRDHEPSRDILEAQERIVAEFEFMGDWAERYKYLVDLGRKLPEFPEEWKTDANRLHGCQSQVWLHTEILEGKLEVQATSDAAIVSGLIALLLRVYSGRDPEEILTTPPEFIGRIGLAQHLSPTRSNGLHAMIKAIRRSALEAL